MGAIVSVGSVFSTGRIFVNCSVFAVGSVSSAGSVFTVGMTSVGGNEVFGMGSALIGRRTVAAEVEIVDEVGVVEAR